MVCPDVAEVLTELSVFTLRVAAGGVRAFIGLGAVEVYPGTRGVGFLVVMVGRRARFQ